MHAKRGSKFANLWKNFWALSLVGSAYKFFKGSKLQYLQKNSKAINKFITKNFDKDSTYKTFVIY